MNLYSERRSNNQVHLAQDSTISPELRD